MWRHVQTVIVCLRCGVALGVSISGGVRLLGLLACAYRMKEKGLRGQSTSRASLLVELNVLAGEEKPSNGRG